MSHSAGLGSKESFIFFAYSKYKENILSMCSNASGGDAEPSKLFYS